MPLPLATVHPVPVAVVVAATEAVAVAAVAAVAVVAGVSVMETGPPSHLGQSDAALQLVGHVRVCASGSRNGLSHDHHVRHSLACDRRCLWK